MRGHGNLLKRLLVHAGAFNPGLCMRTLFGIGTPRTLQGRAVALGVVLGTLWRLVYEAVASMWDHRVSPSLLGRPSNDLVTYA